MGGPLEAPHQTTVEVGYGGNERLMMNMGPQHPSAHGVFRAILTLEGETVVAVDAVIGYLHRCHEKLAETLTYVQYPSIASKTDYVAAMTAELAYVSAVEKVGAIEVPKRAQYLRVIVGELQRIASHCLWLGTWCMDMGAPSAGATIFLCLRGGDHPRPLQVPRAPGSSTASTRSVGSVDMPRAAWTACGTP
jgi:NADH:ubiquinone oxidoreductase subunit D